MDDKWIKEAPLNSAGFDVEAQHFESLLLQAAYKVDNCKSPNESLSVILENPLIVERPKGYSRCSSSAQRASYVLGVEDSCHRACDVICYQVLPLSEEYSFQYLPHICRSDKIVDFICHYLHPVQFSA
jgi:hypothetical protein